MCFSVDSNEDREWITNVMDYYGVTFPLEARHEFRLIERERNFRPGQFEMENITTAIEQSRRMIIVLSR